MAKASINFAKSTKGGLRHNDRSEEQEPEYLLPKEFRQHNDVDISAYEAEKKIHKLYNQAKKNYYARTKQKLQSTSYRWEAIVNLNKEHTMEDVQRLVYKIEEETGFTSIQIAIHRDEGHVNERGIAIYNYHAHLTFFTLDKETGINLYRRTINPSDRRKIEEDIFKNNDAIRKGEAKSEERKAFNKLVNIEIKKRGLKVMDRQRLAKLQTLTAKTLGMQRGKVSVKEEAKRLGVAHDNNPAQRLEHKPYREMKKSELAKQKELKEEIRRLREELKEAHAEREAYAKLEQLNRDLKSRIRLKDLTKEELIAIIIDYKALSNVETYSQNLDEAYASFDTYPDLNDEDKNLNSAYPSLDEAYPNKIQDKHHDIVTFDENDIRNDKLTQENKALKNDILDVVNDKLRVEAEKETILEEFKEFEKDIDIFIEKYKKLQEEHTALKQAYTKLKKAYDYLKDKYDTVVNKFIKKEEDDVYRPNR